MQVRETPLSVDLVSLPRGKCLLNASGLDARIQQLHVRVLKVCLLVPTMFLHIKARRCCCGRQKLFSGLDSGALPLGSLVYSSMRSLGSATTRVDLNPSSFPNAESDGQRVKPETLAPGNALPRSSIV